MKSLFHLVPFQITQSPDGVLWTTNVLSSHGTLLARAPIATPTVFTTIAELGDITPPEFMRNEFDATAQQENIDSYVLGVLRRGAFTVPINFIPTDGTHDHVTGLYKAMITEPPPIEGYRITYMSTGVLWILSGQVRNIVPKAPVDGKLAADITIRFSGKMAIGPVGSLVIVG